VKAVESAAGSSSGARVGLSQPHRSPLTVSVAPSPDHAYPIGGRSRHCVADPTLQRDLRREITDHQRSEEAVITAIVAAVLFAIALLLHLSGLSLGPLDVTFFQLAGLVAVALHLAGIGATRRGRVHH
jgi:hypothetical protein